ncbi:MAG: DUF1858 domain-containing protein [Ruminiclostridium sp.]|nr:DUF1858 domain-containing protein [Ruminiclostridium sp.]
MTVTKDTLIGEILQENAEAAAPYFFQMGMHCLGCPSALGETIEEACLVHDTDPDTLIEQLNSVLA